LFQHYIVMTFLPIASKPTKNFTSI